VPEAVHRGTDDLPFVDMGDGNELKVIQVWPPMTSRRSTLGQRRWCASCTSPSGSPQ
jgi:hypothetical protein